jgi:hypothetical protein
MNLHVCEFLIKIHHLHFHAGLRMHFQSARIRKTDTSNDICDDVEMSERAKKKKKNRICPKWRFKYFQATRDAIDEL